MTGWYLAFSALIKIIPQTATPQEQINAGMTTSAPWRQRNIHSCELKLETILLNQWAIDPALCLSLSLCKRSFSLFLLWFFSVFFSRVHLFTASQSTFLERIIQREGHEIGRSTETQSKMGSRERSAMLGTKSWRSGRLSTPATPRKVVCSLHSNCNSTPTKP